MQMLPENSVRHLDLCFVVGVCVLEEGGKHWEPSGKHCMWDIVIGLGLFGVMKRKYGRTCKRFSKPYEELF